MKRIFLLMLYGACAAAEFLAQWGKERCAKALKEPADATPPPPEVSR